jgi:hypothetical protein
LGRSADFTNAKLVPRSAWDTACSERFDIRDTACIIKTCRDHRFFAPVNLSEAHVIFCKCRTKRLLLNSSESDVVRMITEKAPHLLQRETRSRAAEFFDPI